MLHQARYDLLGFLRNRQARFFTLVLPLLFLVIFVSVFGNHTVRATGVKASTYYVPGLSALAVIAGSFVNLVISITAQREGGILKRRRATPVSAWVLIAGRTLTAISVSLVVMTVVLLVGRFAYGVHFPASTIPGIAITAVVGSTTFCILGYALSTAVRIRRLRRSRWCRRSSSPSTSSPASSFPTSTCRPGSATSPTVFPVQHLADGLDHAYDPTVHGIGIVWSDLGVLALWALVGLAVALRRFSWTPATASESA